jgi:hypothetical protein
VHLKAKAVANVEATASVKVKKKIMPVNVVDRAIVVDLKR